MYCSNCGQRLADDARHCPNCGVLIRRDTASPAEEPEKTGADPYDPTPAEQYSYGSASDPYDTKPGQDPYAQRPAGRESYGYPVQPTREDSSALTGLILSIVGGVCSCAPFIGLPCAILGIIFSAKGMKSANRRAMAVIGLILSIIFTVCNLVTGYSAAVMLANPDAWQDLLSGAGIDYDFNFRFR